MGGGVRAFDERHLAAMEEGSSHEVSALVREVRRLYEAEDRQAQVNGSVSAMLMGTFQRLQGESRAIEAVVRMVSPPAPPSTPDEPAKRRPRVLMDEQPD
jgi:hypothetical protein